MKQLLLGGIAILMLSLPLAGLAQGSAGQKNLPPDQSGSDSSGPALPDLPKGNQGQEVVIRHGDNQTFYEYRVNGILKEIKVVPKHGPAYYLVPSDGGGWIRQDKSQMLVPSWIIFRW